MTLNTGHPIVQIFDPSNPNPQNKGWFTNEIEADDADDGLRGYLHQQFKLHIDIMDDCNGSELFLSKSPTPDIQVDAFFGIYSTTMEFYFQMQGAVREIRPPEGSPSSWGKMTYLEVKPEDIKQITHGEFMQFISPWIPKPTP